ncbi:MAG: TIM barrel protein [Caldilineaceae bacterium]
MIGAIRPMYAVMQQVDHPAIAVNWDIMHPIRAGGATMGAYAALRPWIQHVHVHDGSTRLDTLEMLPVGTGDIDHRLAIELLYADHYTGYLVASGSTGSPMQPICHVSWPSWNSMSRKSQ